MDEKSLKFIVVLKCPNSTATHSLQLQTLLVQRFIKRGVYGGCFYQEAKLQFFVVFAFSNTRLFLFQLIYPGMSKFSFQELYIAGLLILL